MFPSVFPSPPIKTLAPSDIPALYELVRQGDHETEDAYFERSFEEQEAQRRVVFISGEPGQPVGYVHYNRFPKYAMFRRFNIPEIQDLFVHPDFRRRGIGASLMNRCEDQAAKDSCREIGIGVGIISDFGNAQRLYSERGYIPDGAGVVFDREPVRKGEIRPMDDRLCLMLVKQLGRI